MQILYDAIVAFLCCAGIVVTFCALFKPRIKGDTRVAGVIVSENIEDIVGFTASLSAVFKDIIVVTNLDLEGVIPQKIKVISPEEFGEYVTGANQN